MPQGQRKCARWSPAVHGPHVQQLCSFLRTGNPGRPQGSQLSEASVPLNAKTFVIRGSNSKIPSTDPELTSCTTINKLPDARVAPEQPIVLGLLWAGTTQPQSKFTISITSYSTAPTSLTKRCAQGAGMLAFSPPHHPAAIVASREVAFIFPVYSRLPKSPGLSRSGPALANSVNYLVCAKTQVACKLRPACNFPQTCFGGL